MVTFTVSEQREMNRTLSKQSTKLNTHGYPTLFEKEYDVRKPFRKHTKGDLETTKYLLKIITILVGLLAGTVFFPKTMSLAADRGGYL